MTDTTPTCLACGITAQETPLLRLEFRDQAWYICAQHLPLLIHKPQQIAHLLPGFEPPAGADHAH